MSPIEYRFSRRAQYDISIGPTILGSYDMSYDWISKPDNVLRRIRSFDTSMLSSLKRTSGLYWEFSSGWHNIYNFECRIAYCWAHSLNKN